MLATVLTLGTLVVVPVVFVVVFSRVFFGVLPMVRVRVRVVRVVRMVKGGSFNGHPNATRKRLVMSKVFT